MSWLNNFLEGLVAIAAVSILLKLILIFLNYPFLLQVVCLIVISMLYATFLKIPIGNKGDE